MDRWGALFADADAEWAGLEAAELEAEVLDRLRGEAAAVSLSDRLRAALGTAVRVRVPGDLVDGVVDGVGTDWLVLTLPGRGQALVPTAGVLGISGLPGTAATAATASRVAARLTLTAGLRTLARERIPVRMRLTDASEVSGTIDRVGRDYVELAEHPAGEPRRAGAVQDRRVIPLSALAVVRSA